MKAFLLTAMVFMALSFPLTGNAGMEQTRSITAAQAADRILDESGTVRMVLLYRSTCPACVKVFDDFLELAMSYEDEIIVLAFSTDKSAGALDRYLDRYLDGDVPFERARIKKWKPGNLDKAFRPTGIDIGKTFGTPLFAVLNEDDELVGQHEGTKGVKRAKKWLKAAGVSP